MKIYFKLGNRYALGAEKEHVLEIDTEDFLDRVISENKNLKSWTQPLFNVYGTLFVRDEGLREIRNVRAVITKEELEEYLKPYEYASEEEPPFQKYVEEELQFK